MAEVLTELVAKITTDAAGLKSGLSDAEKAVDKAGSGIKRSVESIKKSIDGISAAWAGVGVALIAGMTKVGKSAMDAVESENLFTVSLGSNAKAAREWSNELGRALGINTFELRKQVGVIYTMISSMGLGKDAALDMARGVTQLAYDMASFYNLPVEEAFNKIKSGLVGMPRPLQDLGIVINETTAQTWALKNGLIEQGEEMTNQQKVTARYNALLEQTSVSQGDMARTIDSPTNKIRVLGSAMEELFVLVGNNVLPALSNLLKSFDGITGAVRRFVEANPELVKALIAASFAINAVIFSVMALKVAVILLGTAINIRFGAILAAIGLLVTGIVLLWQNWDKVSHALSDAWSNTTNAILHGIDFILAGLEKFLGFIPGIGGKIRSARESIANMIDAEKVKRDAKDVERTIAGMTDAIKSELEQQKIDALAALSDKKKMAQEEYDNAVTKIKEEYGEYKSATKNKMDLARDAHDESIRLLKSEYDQKIRTLNAEADYKISAIQSEIDAIDKQTEQEDRALTIQAEQKRLKELKATGTAEEILAYETEIRRKELLRQRQDEKDSLRKQINTIRENTRTAQDILTSDLATAKSLKDTALEEELIRLNEERKQKEAAKLKEYNDTVKLLTNEETAISASFDARLTEAAIYQAALEATLKDIEQTITTHYVSDYSGGGNEGTSGGGGGGGGGGGAYDDPYYLQTGGIVKQPTLAMIGEAGPEAVIPLNEMGSIGGITVNISGPLFMEREDQMNQLVDKIRKGIQRSDRLRFGGAYSG